MPWRIPDKTLAATLLVAFSAVVAVSCNDRKTTAGDLSKNSPPPVRNAGGAADKPEPEPELYFGEDWEQKAGGRIAGPGQQSTANDAQYSTWALVLGTFTEGDHAAAAMRMIGNLQVIAPQVQGARVHTTPKGSMVVYGRYKDREDPSAKADQEKLKQITNQGHQVFKRIPLTRIDMRLAQGQLSPLDLLSARRAHPNVDPLYTLDVAIWMANEDKSLGGIVTPDEVRRKAEAYAKELRAKGHEAYFYHDDVNKRSIVTVGLFDHRAIHPKSGLYSSDVTSVIKQFPQRLANGEPVLTLKARFVPQLGTQPQTPVLVLVPTM